MGDKIYGTAAPDAPVTRADFERALRHLNMSDHELRDAVLQLAARVVAMTDELTRRIDQVEPDPAPPGTPAAPSTLTIEQAIGSHLAEALRNVRVGDAAQPTRVSLDLGGDKYTTQSTAPNCEELLHLCRARCCTLSFALSTQDLDEGVIRWDYGQPYLIRQRESDGYCVHCDPDDLACTVHQHRPRVCRAYDCRDDARIWIDFAQKIPQPVDAPLASKEPRFDLLERARARAKAAVVEKKAINDTFADRGPVEGPKP
ncbi:MAG: YkgJ family cysteine cluster protein [Kofleriaceae bacterium]